MENRNEIVDFYKGFLMWGVILGHLITALKGGLDVGPIFIHTFIRTYDMPFFMILSGFFLSKSLVKYSIKTVLANRVTMILFPILIWNIISMNFNFTSFYFLWAVFVSSVICIISYSIEHMINGKRWYVELILEILFIIALHFINIPWNLFYLFPFFVIGRYMSNIEFKVPNFTIPFIIFVTAQCFWKGTYSPWVVGFDAWQEDMWLLIIYFYRIVLGILGAYIIANVLLYIFKINWGGQKYLVKAGSQTLGIYILQSIVVEKYIGRIMKFIVSETGINYSDSIINLMGYVIAPILSFFILVTLSKLITRIEGYKYTKFVFGFKLKL